MIRFGMREGEYLSLGFNIGWIAGPAVKFMWIDVMADRLYVYSWRYSIPSKKFFFRKVVTDNWKNVLVDNYMFERGLSFVTNQRLADVKIANDAVKSAKMVDGHYGVGKLSSGI